MSGKSKYISSRSGMLALLLVLVVWTLPVHADRQHEDWQQLIFRAAEQLLSKDNRAHADSSATNTRRYPPRHNEKYEKYENQGYSDKRNNQKNGRTRTYGSSNSREQYKDREVVTEKRRYYKDKRQPYSPEPRGNKKYSKENGRYPGGNARGRRDASLDDAVSRVRRQSDGRVLSAETVRQDNREEHRVRIITDDGRVRRYRMDAETGDILPRRR